MEVKIYDERVEEMIEEAERHAMKLKKLMKDEEWEGGMGEGLRVKIKDQIDGTINFKSGIREYFVKKIDQV